MKTTLALSTAAIALLIGSGLAAPPAEAGYVVDLTQVGSDVYAKGSGAIDLSGLSFVGSSSGQAEIWPFYALILTGPTTTTPFDDYTGISGPTSFGGGGITGASSGAGDFVGVSGVSQIVVPAGYVSGAALSDTATYGGQTFESLGVTPGTYEWTWGTGANQNFTVNVGIPEPSTWALTALGFGLLGLAGWRSRGPSVSVAA